MLCPFTRKKVQLIVQDPFSSFDPKKNFAFSPREPCLRGGLGNEKTLDAQTKALVEKVGLDSSLLARFPSELSGGECQRMGIARALLLMPEVLICDEPVCALDISIQAQILNLLKSLQKEVDLTYLFISHDLSVTNYMSEEVAVIYNGRIVEKGSSAKVLTDPKHPYTNLLIDSIAPASPFARKPAPPAVASAQMDLSGCPLIPRCAKRLDICKNSPPPSVRLSPQHRVECFLFQ